jgi:hypothetical protein
MKNNFSKTLVVLISITILTSSCFKNFYLTNSQKSLSTDVAERVQADNNKFVIVHFSDQTFELTKYTISNQAIEGDIHKIEIPEHLMYLNPEENSSNRYKKRYESAVLNEIHIYTPLKSEVQNSNHINLTAKDISRIDIYKKDKNRTNVNQVLSIVGLATGATILVATIIFVSTPMFAGPFLIGSF